MDLQDLYADLVTMKKYKIIVTRKDERFRLSAEIQKIRSQIHYLENKEKIKAKAKAWKEDPQNSQKLQKSIKRYYKKHRVRRGELLQKWRTENREKVRTCRLKYRERENADARRRQALNKKQNYDKFKERTRTDISFRIGCRLRGRLHHAIKAQGAKKLNKTLDLLGCSMDFFFTHIQSQFQPGMSWDNYGSKTWHIDHIIPCIAFNLEQEDQQKKCFHFTNLRPLWASENHSKQDRLLNGLIGRNIKGSIDSQIPQFGVFSQDEI